MKGPHLNRQCQGMQLSGPCARTVGAALLALSLAVGGAAVAAPPAPVAGQGEVARLHATLKQFRQEQANAAAATGAFERLLNFFGGGDTSADDSLAEALQASKDRLAQEAGGQDAALATVRERLQARQAPARALTRHDDTVRLIRERRAALMAQLDAVQQAHANGNDDQRRQALDSLWQSLEQWRGAPAPKAKFDNLPWGTPRHQPRAPHESKVGYSLNLQMFGIKPLQVAGPIPAGTVLPVLPQLPEAPQPADFGETEDIQLTPAIRAKAAALHHNPSEIYRWVHDTIEFVPSYGSLQGADYTLQTKRGNAFDTSSLLIALLRASNIPARYVYGTVEVPIEQARNWVGGVTSADAVLGLLAQGGIPHTGIAQGGQPAAVRLEHVWVEAFVDYVPSRGVVQKQSDTWIPLDASFKQYTFTTGVGLKQAVPLDAQALSTELQTGASVNSTTGYAQNIDQGRIQSSLLAYQQRLQNYLSQYHPNATLGDVLGKQIIKAYPGKLLSATLPLKLVTVAGDFQQLPDTMRHYLVFKVYADTSVFTTDTPTLNLRRSLPSLAGKKLALSYVPATDDDAATLSAFLPAPHPDGSPIQPGELPASLPGYLINVSPQLTLDGQPLLQNDAAQMLGGHAFTRSGIESPGQPLVLAENHLFAGHYQAIGIDSQGMSVTQLQQSLAALEATRLKLQSPSLANLERHELYGGLLQAGLGSYFGTGDVQDQVAAQAAGVVSYRLPSFGSVASTLHTEYSYGVPVNVTAGGVAVDIDQLAWSAVDRANDLNKARAWTLANGSRMSANAHLVLEQMFSTPTQRGQAVSAVKALQLAAQQGQKLYALTSGNAGTVLPTLPLDESLKDDIRNAVASGRQVLTTEANVSYAGWTGAGYVMLDDESLAGIYHTRAASSDTAPAPDLTGYLPAGLGFEILQSVPAGVTALPVNAYTQTYAAGTAQLDDVATHLAGCGNGTLPAMQCLNYPVGNLLQDALAGVAASGSPSAFGLGTVLLASGSSLAVSVEVSPNTLKIGETTYIRLHVSGAATSTPSLQASVNGQPLTLDANGMGSFTATTAGIFTVAATVTDGSETSQGRATLTVRDPSDTTQPEVRIHSPELSARITAPVDIVATVRDAALKEYTVAISPAGKQAYTVIARGTQSVTNAVIAKFDPTLLTNGQWDLLVTATDLNGLTHSDKITVRVKGDLKLGHFAFTVTDVEVPLVGIPIRVTRTYDTRRRAEKLDFGQGWSVGYQDGKVEESRPLGQYWDLNQYRSGPMNAVVRYCVEPRGKPIVTVTLPTGQVETFEVTVNEPCSLYQPEIDGLYLAYTPIDNTLSTLQEESPYPMRLANGELVDNASFMRYDPSRYKLTTKAGFVYHLDQGFGIRYIEDPNGNTITYTPNGIIHSAGPSVTFERDNSGRIKAIRDPNGNVRRYHYDASGDLVGAAEPVAASATTPAPTTSYRYYTVDDGFAHYLQEIRDPLNRTLLKNIYDNDGRLIAQEDGAGNRVQFTHNLTGRTSVVTNRRGYSTQYAYDAEGRILTQIDALNGITTNEWDARGNLLKKTNANQEVTSATYNERNDQLTQTDGEGKTTTYTHNLRGQELTIKDARQNTYTMTYDTVGNLLTLKDPLENLTGNVIGAKGLLQKTTNALQQSTSWTYDSKGRKETETNALGHVTRWTYDDNGNVRTESRMRTVNGTSVTETLTHTYDSRGRRTSTTDALGHVTRIEYDLAGNESARIDAKNRRMEMDHDAYGRLTETRYPDGTKETHAYDAEGNKIASTDRLGRTTAFVYDALNRLMKTTFPDGTSTRTEYDAVGRVKAEIDARNNRTEYAYDKAGRRTLVRNALQQVRTFGYDDDGNLTSETDALNRTTTYVVDALDRRTQVVHPDTTVEKTVYDALGRVKEKEDELQRKTTFGYDAAGRLTEVKDHRQQVTSYGYDEAGNKTRQTDAKQQTTRWTHDANGNVLTHMLPLGQAESFTYDENGNAKAHTDFNGQVTSFFYDQNDRQFEVRYADGGKDVTVFNALGSRLKVEDYQPVPNGAGYNARSTTYTYDGRDRLKTQANPDGSSLAYDYDAAGNRTQLTATYPNGTSSVTDYTFDALNRLKTVTAAEGVTTYEYDEVGNRKSLRHANGATVRYGYDARNRLKAQEHLSPAQEVTQRYDYTLDATGRRTRVGELDGRVTTYGYDDLYRLETETQSGGTAPAFSASYQYDAVGNRTYSIVDGVHTAYTYDANDRLTQQGGETYTYDAAGNTRTHTLDGQTTTYTYDARQRLIATQGPSGTAQYGYDHDGNRIQKSVGGQSTQYLIDAVQDYPQVIAELQNGSPQLRYTLGDERLSRQDSAATFRFYEADGHGNIRALTDAAGALTDRYAYDAFGTLLQTTGSSANDFRYTGERFDESSGLYYLRARHYSPHSGRFTQRDTWAGNSQDPITLHKYVYGNSDPVNHTDPSGNFSLVEFGVADTIRTELTSLQIDTGFSLLDRITDGQSEQFTGPLAQANQALMLGVAAIGGVQMLKMLSRKFRSACNSFDGETLVHTKDGLRPIRDIKIGDEVLAFNEQTGQQEYSPVVHLIRSDKEQGWVDVATASGEVIKATAEHPFYAKAANDEPWQWVDAAKLLQGLDLYTAANDTDDVARTQRYTAHRLAYNLTVNTTHTYFVGKEGVLVHNSGCNFGFLEKARAAARSAYQNFMRTGAYRNATVRNGVALNTCVQCATAFEDAFKRVGVRGKRLSVRSETDIIYSDTAGTRISTNGFHDAVEVDGYVFDNVHPNGIPRAEWEADMHSIGDDIVITTEYEF
jgi:RHS repeat-associated protein